MPKPTRYKTFDLPTDEYGHVSLPDAKTDPYGDLEFVVGSDDDFHCFAYAFFDHGDKRYCALHSVINCETGHFIQDADYVVVDLTDGNWEGELLIAAAELVRIAIEWMTLDEPPYVRHDKKGWNQDPYYFVRAVARAGWKHGVESEGITRHSRRASWFRYGSKTLNRAIEALSPLLRGTLPVTRPPKQLN